MSQDFIDAVIHTKDQAPRIFASLKIG